MWRGAAKENQPELPFHVRQKFRDPKIFCRNVAGTFYGHGVAVKSSGAPFRFFKSSEKVPENIEDPDSSGISKVPGKIQENLKSSGNWEHRNQPANR